MIKIEKTDVVGVDAALRGMRNPLESWEKSDSYWGMIEDPSPINPSDEFGVIIGPKDFDLARRLSKAGTDHRKYMRMIVVYVDVTAPLYWWKEYDTYKVGTVANSCSTMHKIAGKEFTIDNFSCENLTDDFSIEPELTYTKENCFTSKSILEEMISVLNHHRMMFTETKDKKYWWQMIQLLPSSYNQKRTLMVNYEVLANMYHARKNHKLDEWREFCKWIETLPNAELITEIKSRQIDAEPATHAHWIHKRGYDGDRHTVCSNCGGDRCGHFNFKFCPDCGAKMDEEE